MIDSERSLYGWIEPFLVVPAESLSYSVATVCGGRAGAGGVYICTRVGYMVP